MAKKKEEEAPEWVTSNIGLMLFTSLMIILLAFFIMLSSMAVVDERRQIVAMGSILGAFGILPGGLSPAQSTTTHVAPPTKPLEPIHTSLAEEELGPAGLPRAGRIEVGDLHLEVSPQYFAPVPMVAPDGRFSRFPRCLARFRDESGRKGYGWIEWNQPQQG